MTALQTAQSNATRRHDNETLAEYVIRITDNYMLQESEFEYIRRTGRTTTMNEHLALQLAMDRKELLTRLREAVGVLNPRYDKFFQRKDQRFDFEQKRLYGHSGFYMQWSLRPDPTAPESYENQQTSVGCVSLDRVTTA